MEVTPPMSKLLNLLRNKGIDNNDFKGMWDILTDDLFIEDKELKKDIMYAYYLYPKIKDYRSLIDEFIDTESIDRSLINNPFEIALNRSENIPGIFIDSKDFVHHGMPVFEDISTGTLYAVGWKKDVDKAMMEWAKNRVRYDFEYIEEDVITRFIDLSELVAKAYAKKQAINIYKKYSDKKIKDEAEYYYMEVEESSVEELRDDLIENKAEEIFEDIEVYGIRYFMREGITFDDAIEMFYDVRKKSLIKYLADNVPFEEILSSSGTYKTYEVTWDEYIYIFDLNT
jgi:hypothetical protein